MNNRNSYLRILPFVSPDLMVPPGEPPATGEQCYSWLLGYGENGWVRKPTAQQQRKEQQQLEQQEKQQQHKDEGEGEDAAKKKKKKKNKKKKRRNCTYSFPRVAPGPAAVRAAWPRR